MKENISEIVVLKHTNGRTTALPVEEYEAGKEIYTRMGWTQLSVEEAEAVLEKSEYIGQPANDQENVAAEEE